jgi:hypothetical protein
MVTWELLFNGSALPVPPAPGDVFLLKILKPFRHDDLYEFRALAGGLTAIASTTEPGEFTLEQNFPNPFNGSTVVTYEVSGFGSQGSGAYGQVPEASAVRLVVYDMLGREVAVLVNEKKAPGKYTVAFDAGRLASGVYLCRLTAGRTMQVRKMLLVR